MIRVFVVLMTMGLASCASMNSHYDCPNKAGVQCKSLDQINSMVDRGVIGSHMQSANHLPVTMHAQRPKAGDPIRYGERVQRIWVAPYEDTEHNYHDAHYLYTVVQPGHWIGAPVKSVTTV